MLTIGSLCSGACDGLSLGLEWAGLGPTLWQVEIEDDRRANLARHWPDADRGVHDVHLAGKTTLAPVGLVCCSSPCQDLSSAGKRAGLAGDRSGLWFECLRVIGELRPEWVVVENVASGARNWVPHVREGLERLGYTTLPIPIAAADCGAPHLRRRVFVLAHADRGEQHALTIDGQMGGASKDVGDAAQVESQARQGRELDWGSASRQTGANSARCHSRWPTELELGSRLHGLPAGMGDAEAREISWLGDSVVPQQAEVIGHVIRELAAQSRRAA